MTATWTLIIAILSLQSGDAMITVRSGPFLNEAQCIEAGEAALPRWREHFSENGWDEPIHMHCVPAWAVDQ